MIDDLGAEVGELTRGKTFAKSEDASADAVACLEDDDRLARLGQPPGGGETRVPGADDADVRFTLLAHGITTRRNRQRARG